MEPQMQNVSASSVPSATYAGFGLRFLAFIIDAIILGAVVSILSFLMGLPTDDPGRGGLSFVIGWLYYSFMESSEKQGTVGKLVVHIKATDISGNRLSFWHATGRHFGKILSSVILGIGFLMVIWTEKKQGLHDIIAKTLVVKR